VIIHIDDVSVAFGGVRPLDGLTVDLAGPVVGVVGPNGAGKTTLLNVISGFVRTVSGTVVVDDVDILSMAPYERARWGVRRSFQTEQVVDALTVGENVEVILDTAGFGHDQRSAAVEQALDMVGLGGLARSPTQTLNAYQRRLVELARAVAGSPKVILLDEPAAGLSEHETAELRATLARLPGETGAQLILIDHDVDLIAAVCETTAVLDFGRLIAYGPTVVTLNDRAVKEAYLGVAETAL
jgi:branched-chain amino acid transport system ATP-binding protein